MEDDEFTLTITRTIPRVLDAAAPIDSGEIPRVLNTAAPIDSKYKGDFRLRGACLNASDPEVFFTSRQEAIAKAYCRYCPVIRECLAFAMSPDVIYSSMAPYGVFGGLSEEERAVLRRSGEYHHDNVA